MIFKLICGGIKYIFRVCYINFLIHHIWFSLFSLWIWITTWYNFLIPIYFWFHATVLYHCENYGIFTWFMPCTVIIYILFYTTYCEISSEKKEVYICTFFYNHTIIFTGAVWSVCVCEFFSSELLLNWRTSFSISSISFKVDQGINSLSFFFFYF